MKKSDIINETIDFFVTKELNSSLIEIINNYKFITINALKQLKLSYDNTLIKPIILYNLFYTIEVYLKYILIKDSSVSLESIEKYGHDISLLISECIKEQVLPDYEELNFLIIQFKNKNGKSLDISKYTHFRYNRFIGNNSLIFTNDLSKKDKIKIKDVIEWLDLHI